MGVTDNAVLFLCFLFPLLIVWSEANPYCNIRNCLNNTHTLCRYPLFRPANACHMVIRHGLTDYEQARILELHNFYRSYVYSGHEIRGDPGPLPKSTYIQKLKWDNELANIAQAWAEQCQFGHDDCRNVDRWVVGQNIGWETTFGPDVEVLTIDLIVRKWYEEVVRFDRRYIYMYNREVSEMTKTERFSQMIWQFTRKIGCGSMRFFDGINKRFLLVCNYGHKGNFSGKAVYRVKH